MDVLAVVGICAGCSGNAQHVRSYGATGTHNIEHCLLEALPCHRIILVQESAQQPLHEPLCTRAVLVRGSITACIMPLHYAVWSR